MCEDFAPNFLVQNNLLLYHEQRTVLHELFHQGISVEDKTERQPFWHNWGNRGRIAEHDF
jgi:hypothetical protein